MAHVDRFGYSASDETTLTQSPDCDACSVFDDRDDGRATMRGRLAAPVLVAAELRHRAAEDRGGFGERQAAERAPFSEPACERRRADARRRWWSRSGGDSIEDRAHSLGARDGVAALVIADQRLIGRQAEGGAGFRLREPEPLAPAAQLRGELARIDGRPQLRRVHRERAVNEFQHS